MQMRRIGTWVGAVAALAVVASFTPEAASGAAAVDVTAPVIDSVTGPGPAVRSDPVFGSASLTYTWSGHDAEGSVTYELRYGFTDSSSDPVPEPSSWTAVTLPSPSDTTWSDGVRPYDPDFCVQVRARDGAGNTSAWTGPPCTDVDDDPPWVDSSRGLTLFHDGLASTPVSFGYVGGDSSDRVASYDVDERVAQPGAPFGPWTSPSAWQGIAARSVAVAARAGSSVCIRVRARDRAANVGAYDFPRCKAVPYDDRAFARHDGARRVRHRDTLGGSATRLARSASLTRRHVLASSVWVRLVGPRQGVCARVSLGPRKHPLTTCSLFHVGRHTWQGFFFPRPLRGKLRIRSNWGWQVVDAIGTDR
jgi:hypothetical protein